MAALPEVSSSSSTTITVYDPKRPVIDQLQKAEQWALGNPPWLENAPQFAGIKFHPLKTEKGTYEITLEFWPIVSSRTHDIYVRNVFWIVKMEDALTPENEDKQRESYAEAIYNKPDGHYVVWLKKDGNPWLQEIPLFHEEAKKESSDLKTESSKKIDECFKNILKKN